MRPIDANSAKSSILVVADCITIDCDWLNGYKTGLLAATAAIDEIPTIEAEPVKHGRWEADKEDIYWGNHLVRMFCSCCKQNTYFDREKGKFILFDYCPNCGAKMQGGNEHE